METLVDQPVLPVIVIDDADQAVPLANAFLEGGLHVCEVTFRTAAAAEAIRRIRQDVPQMRIGAGTLLSPDQAKQAIDAGAQFGLAPGLDEAIVGIFQEAKIPFMPGIMTPSEIGRALKLDCHYLKFFPAESAGGATALKAMLAPFKAMSPRICPTGGIRKDALHSYLAIPEVFTVGGSWLATRDQIANGEWDAITATTKAALALASSAP